MAPHPRDLCTLAEVRRFLGLKPEQTSNDTLIEELITDVSDRIHRETGREFVAENAEWIDPDEPERGITVPEETRTFITTGVGQLRVGDLREIASATTNGETADITGWQLLPYGAGPFRRLGFAVDGSVVYRAGVAIAITGRWGWPLTGAGTLDDPAIAAIPPAIRGACRKQVAIEYQRDVAQFAETFNLEESRREMPRGFASAIWDVLDGYRDVGPIFA